MTVPYLPSLEERTMNNRLLTALILCLSATSSIAMADDTVTKFKCGNIPIVLYNSNVVESPFFVISIGGPSPSFHAFLVTEEFLEVRCEKDKQGKDFLLVNHFCGGSGCSESNYALVELPNGKEVLKASEPQHGNEDQAASILGKPLTPFSCKKWSKDSTTPNDNGEFCLISPLELY